MNEVYIQNTIKMINKQKGQQYPCSNQIVSKIIYVNKIDQKVENYLKSIGAEWVYRQKTEGAVILNNEKWIVLSANQKNRGYRAYEAKIDKRIDDYAFSTFICGTLSSYCHKVEFF